MSDFITPRFYDQTSTPASRYSFTGAIQAPRQILPGGYISWVDPTTNELQQILWVDPSKPPELRTLGPATGLSLRVFVESHTHHLVHEKRQGPSQETRARRKAYRDHDAKAVMRARHYE